MKSDSASGGSAPAAPTTADDDPLFRKIEEAIKLASELGEESVYDFVHGRGMKLARERIRDEVAALRASLADARRQLDETVELLRTERLHVYANGVVGLATPYPDSPARAIRRQTFATIHEALAAARAAVPPEPTKPPSP